ncbi:helix-turn-helix domain-containing protein [Mangrovibrevibacter kandeliae]|uniref:helix-turn-helix domain-containing protein n=1 Tax=Mangrovibrevibacter kandeliae TaxID=2968473 RepID=UPI0021188018|nr:MULTISPECIES: helix-turn-helix domain-containing protein [unclassified Aurantimonas]MCQ8783884.1 helix-turn-helix domain containing protein [Aurantimonas sp. CSK15Z-1]MCW4116603.1 helix-turn-helix domain containing protein [Aurantimonas sp. MSK8Z-1]
MSGSTRGDRVAEAMARRGWRKDVALAQALGVNVSTVYRWRIGGEFSLDHAIAFCQLLDISLDWLLLGRGRPEIQPLPAAAEMERRSDRAVLHERVRAALCELQTALPDLLSETADEL